MSAKWVAALTVGSVHSPAVPVAAAASPAGYHMPVAAFPVRMWRLPALLTLCFHLSEYQSGNSSRLFVPAWPVSAFASASAYEDRSVAPAPVAFAASASVPLPVLLSVQPLPALRHKILPVALPVGFLLPRVPVLLLLLLQQCVSAPAQVLPLLPFSWL